MLKKLEDMGQLDNTIVVFTTDNGAETITFPDGGITPFKGSKMNTWEGGMRAPCVMRWPGVIKPGTVKDDIFASLDWLPTLVEIAGGDKGDALNKRIMAGTYPGIVKTKLDGVNQIDYLTGKSEKSARDTFFYYSGSHPSAVRYKNWKMYFAIAPETATGFIDRESRPVRWPHGRNIKRDPFEMGWGDEKKANFWLGGALAGPVTAYIYDWNMLPIGQVLWLKELETYKEFPPLQDPASYNLDQVMEQLKNNRRRPSALAETRSQRASERPFVRSEKAGASQGVRDPVGLRCCQTLSPGEIDDEQDMEPPVRSAGFARVLRSSQPCLHAQQQPRSPTSSSSWPTTSVTGTSAPTTAARWAIARPTSIASPTKARSSPTITASNPAPPAAPRSSPAEPAAHRPAESRPAGRERRAVGEGPDDCRTPQAAGLRNRTIRQEPSRRSQRIPADGARLR